MFRSISKEGEKLDPWLEKQLDAYNRFFTEEEKKQHEEDYLLYAFKIDEENWLREGVKDWTTALCLSLPEIQ